MKKILKMIGFLLLYGAAYLVASFIAAIVFVIVLILGNITEGRGNFDPNTMIKSLQDGIMQYTNAIVICTSIIAFLMLLLIFVVRRENLFRACSFKKLNPKTAGVLAIAAISLSFFITFLMSYVMQLSPLQKYMENYQEIMKSLMGGNTLLIILNVGLVAPLFEEIFFRGVIFNELRRNIPVTVAVILQALIFALFHGNVVQGTYAFIIGLVFGLVYLWYKSIWATVILHFLFNNTGLFMDNFISEPVADHYGIVFLAAGFLIFAAAFYYLMKKRKSSIYMRNNREKTLLS